MTGDVFAGLHFRLPVREIVDVVSIKSRDPERRSAARRRTAPSARHLLASSVLSRIRFSQMYMNRLGADSLTPSQEKLVWSIARAPDRSVSGLCHHPMTLGSPT